MSEQPADLVDPHPGALLTGTEPAPPDPREAFFIGVRATKQALREWRRNPRPVLAGWMGGSALATVVLLIGVLIVAELTRGAGPTQVSGPPFQTGDIGNVLNILGDNLMVLALHLLACVAGFTGGSSLPSQAAAMEGYKRTVSILTARFALVFVAFAMVGSLLVQIVTIGHSVAWLGARLDVSPAKVLLGVLPHAALELFAMFLPLAASVRAARRREWDQLLAAVIVTAMLALPILVACASWETWVAPHLVAAIVGPV